MLLMTSLVATKVFAFPQPLTDWLVCGPFPFERQLPQFFTDYLTEHGGEKGIRPKEGMSHTVKGLGEVRWQRCSAPEGFLDFVALLARGKEERPRFWQIRYGLAYAYTEIESDKDQPALLLIGSEDWVAVWLNGVLVHESFVYRHAVPDKDAVLVFLKKGVNRLLLKVARIAGGWGASVRLVAPIKQKIFVKTEPYRPCPPDGNAFFPEFREGDAYPVWGYVTVVNMSTEVLPFVRSKVRANEWFVETTASTGLGVRDNRQELRASLEAGESRQLPFLLVPKRAFRADEKPRLELVVETEGERQEFSFPITVRRRNEPFFSTHRSGLDGSVQPMTLLVPPDYNPQRAYPLVVALHGAKGCLIGHAFSVKNDVILVAPHGRGQTGYREFGERDVFEAIAEVQRRYRIDPDRLYLTGHSMGGGGTFALAVRHPHRWAAIGPMASGGTRPLEWLQNLQHLPTLFYHGSEDEVVPVQLARQAAEYLQRLGYPFRYVEEPGKPHWWGVDFPELFAFFSQHRRVKSPERFVFWVNDPRYHRAYWLEVDDFEDYTKPAKLEVSVERTADGTPLLVLTTDNVRGVTVHLDEAPDGLQQLPLWVQWNGEKALVTQWTNPKTLMLLWKPPTIGVLLGVPEELQDPPAIYASPTARVQWQREGRTLFVTGLDLPLGLLKTPERCGPVMDVFCAPFVIACDNSAGAKLAARQLQHWWQNHALGVARIESFGDDPLAELAIHASLLQQGYHLVIFKRARQGDEHAFQWRLRGKSVLADTGERSFAVGKDWVRIGKQVFRGKTVGFRLLRPSPFHPRCYILLNAGFSDEALRILARVPMDIGQPYDYLVVNERFLKEGVQGLLAVGRFNTSW